MKSELSRLKEGRIKVGTFSALYSVFALHNSFSTSFVEHLLNF